MVSSSSVKASLVAEGTGCFGRRIVQIAVDKYAARSVVADSRDELTRHEILVCVGDVGDGPASNRAFAADLDVVVRVPTLKQRPTTWPSSVLGPEMPHSRYLERHSASEGRVQLV